MTRYFEDFTVGEAIELGSVEVTEAAITGFAEQYDPQPFHIDAAAAARSPFGGLIASGWHTAALFMRLFADAVLLDSSSQGASGIDQMRWRAPVRPGDTLAGRATVLDARRSATAPNRGTVTVLSEMRNQDGTVVLSMKARCQFGTRD